MKFIAIVFTVLFASVAQAQYWQGDLSGQGYNAGEVRRVAKVETARVLDVRDVDINVPNNNRNDQYAGAAVGGVIGGALGSMGHGHNRGMATLLGTTLGAVVGGVATERSTRDRRQGVEFILEMHNGEVLSVTQEMDADARDVLPGDQVRIISGQGVVRIAKLRHNGSYN